MTKDVAEILPNESLDDFLAAMQEFDRTFVAALVAGVDFTIRLEVHGNCGQLLHAKTDGQTWRRPKGVEKEIERQRGSSKNQKKSSR